MNVLADELARYFEEIQPYYFYREIFGDGELDTLDAKTPGKYCGIALEITDQKRKVKDKDGKVIKVIGKDGKEHDKEKVIVYRHTVTDDLDVVDQLTYSPHFCVMAPISYVGKSRTSKNARLMYALGVEVDYLRVKDGQQIGLEALMERWSERCHFIPEPTFVVASGNGLHLYYQFKEPLVLFPNTIESLRNYKQQLTTLIWHKDVTTDYTPEKIQQESIFQAFRMPGTPTRHGDKAVAFRVGGKVSLEYMNSFMYSSLNGICDIVGVYRSKLLLKDAKEKYPEWYEKVIVQGDKGVKEWALSRRVYDWWLRRIKDEAVDGHRFYCLKMLAIYAIKCGNYDPKKNPDPVTQDEFESDVWSLFEDFKARGKRADNPFTEFDILCALQVYEDRGMVTYPRGSIAHKSGIKIEPQVPRRKKGERRKQADHLEEARAVRDVRMKRQGRKWDENNGRPKGSGTAEQKVADYRVIHPEASVTEVARALGISRTTVYKWWDSADPISSSRAFGYTSDVMAFLDDDYTEEE